MTGSLGVADQQRLVDALMRIDGMRHRRSRDLLIDALERELGYRLPIARQDQDLYDVWQLVDTCLSHSGAMHALLEILDAFHRGNRWVEEVAVLIEGLLPDPFLDTRERRELYELVRTAEAGLSADHGMDRTEIRLLYDAAVGPLGPPPDREIRGIESVLVRLEESPVRRDGLPPLLPFLEELAGRVGGPPAEALRAWTQRLAGRLGVDAGRLRRAERAPRPDTPERAYLVIELQPEPPGGDLYMVTAWLQFGREPGMTLYSADETLPLSGLPVLLEALLVDDQQVVNRCTPELTVELIVPRKLLNAPLDQLKISIGGFECRLGIEYPVIVRSLERIRSPRHHHNWRRKWQRLQKDPESAQVCWIGEPGRLAHEWLYAALSSPPVVCLALAFPPESRGPTGVDEHWVGVVAGAPVLAWCRDARQPDRFAAEFRELVGTDPTSLPQRILALRKQAVLAEGDEPEHLGLNLTLIFDDADRIPEPYVRLRAPA